MSEKYLIKNTTREERERIVREALGLDGPCAGCAGCDGLGIGDPMEVYREYIEGKKELRDVNAGFSKGGSVR